jgi:hypothetical protein
MYNSTHVICNQGLITALNKLQDKSINSPLTYYCTLPTNYNIIINSPTNYGQLSISCPSGAMAFGVYDTSTVVNGTYTGVLQGFGDNLSTYISSGTTGNFNGYAWSFTEEGSSGAWDLVFGTGDYSTVINDIASSIYTQSFTGSMIAVDRRIKT